MKQLIEFFPLVIFFALYKMYDIYVGTGALMIATTVSIIASYALYKKVEKMQWITLAFVVIFGGMTLFFHNDDFIKWKVTIIYLVFALGLLITHIIGKPLIKGMLGKEVQLPDKIWTHINYAWVIFFAICALLNIYVAFKLPLDTWVNFKVFGLSAATFVFTLLNVVYIYKYLPKEDEALTQETDEKEVEQESK